MEHLETALEEAGVHRSREASPPAIAFLDLSGYTRRTEEAGDDVAAEHARSLVDLVRRASAQNGGRLVKTLGDGAMFHFDQRPPPCDAGSSWSNGHRARGCRPRAWV